MCQFLGSHSEILSVRKVLSLAFVAFCQLFYFQLLSSLVGLPLCHEICVSKKHHGMGWLSPRSARLWFTQLDFQRGPFAVPLCRGGLAQPVDLYCLAAGSPPWLGNQHICTCQLILK